MFLAPKISRACKSAEIDPRFSFIHYSPRSFRSQLPGISSTNYTQKLLLLTEQAIEKSEMSQYTINDSSNCLNTTNSNNTNSNNTNSFNTNYYTIGDELSPLLTWLSPLDPGLRHSDIQERRVGNIGEWLMETEKFRRWCGLGGEVEDDKAVLFCYGNPGVGKTFISSVIVDRLCDRTMGQHMPVACFYFDFSAQKEQTTTSMLGSILKQVISGTERVPEDIWRALQAQKKVVSGRKPQLDDIVKILQLITSSKRTFMVIDALDESTVAQRLRLFDSLKEIIQKSPGARIFITGRPHICPEIETHLDGRVTSISVGPASDDIVRFLRARLREDETPDAMDSSLEAEILEKIPGSISDMFLLASLNIEAILQESTIHRRRERLRNMTDGLRLEDVYGATIERIKAQGGDKSRLGMGALMWISYTEVPLSPDELCHALAIELGSTDFNADNIPSITTLVSCCQGLISVDMGQYKFESRARLIHFTLKEYFSAHPDTFSKPHSAMAEKCLTYLNSQQFKALSVDFIDDIHSVVYRKPFLKYCTLYWGLYTKKEPSDHSRSLALRLLQEYDCHISAKILLSEERSLRDRPANILILDEPSDTLSPFSGLHCASFLGIVEIVLALMDMGCCDPNGEDFQGCTPLAWAAWKGHEEVVKILLGRKEVDPDKPDNDGHTPLSHAARKGHAEVVKLLLGRGEVNPEKSHNDGATPLSYAARAGAEEVVKMLLERQEVDPGKPDNNGRTPLSWAAEGGCSRVVKVLLGREEVDPDKPGDNGRTPLSYAAKGAIISTVSPRDLRYHPPNEYVRVVLMLLGQENVNPDKPDNDGLTPLSRAAGSGHGQVVKILLGREEVNPDKQDNFGRTPLSCAAGSGHGQVVKLLLGRGEVSPDKPDNAGATPLSYAAWSGAEEVVKMLLERYEVDPGKPDNNGRTPLSWAAEVGWPEVLKVLLGREEVGPDEPGDNGRTPLSYAAGDVTKSARGLITRFPGDHDVGVVKMLLGQENVNPDKPDNDGVTPLSYAAKSGREEVMKILLERHEVDPGKPDNSGRTPLSYAAGGPKESLRSRSDMDGIVRVVKMLLGQENVNPDKQDNQGRTPLSYATENWLRGVVSLVLRREEVNPNKADNDGKTPLMWAPSEWHQDMEALIQSYKGVAHSAIGDLRDTPSRKSLPFLLFPTKPVTGFVPAHLLRANDISRAGEPHTPSHLAPTDSLSNSID